MTPTRGAGFVRIDEGNFAGVQVVTNMSEADFDEGLQTCARVESVNQNEQISLVERNYTRLTALRHFYNHNLSEGLLNTAIKSQLAVSNFSSEVLNWLTATRLFIDHACAQFSRTYGPKSKELAELLALFSNEFDSSLAYRFLYKLRNYTQHIGFPVSEVQLALTDPADPEARTHVEFGLDRDGLLADFDWGAVVGKDLVELPRMIDVLRVIDRAMPSFRRIYSHIFLVRARHAKASVPALRELASRAGKPEDGSDWTPNLIDLREYNPEAGFEKIGLRLIPIQLADFLDDDTKISAAADSFSSGVYAQTTRSPLEVSKADREVSSVGVALMGIFFEDGTSARFDRAVLEYARRYDSLRPAVYGLVRVAAVALYLAGAALGTVAEDILAGLLVNTADGSSTREDASADQEPGRPEDQGDNQA